MNERCYSAIHKAVSSLVTGSSQKIPAAGTTPRGHSPLDSFMVPTVEGWNSTSQNHGTAGNREAGGFVNRAVRSHENQDPTLSWEKRTLLSKFIKGCMSLSDGIEVMS